MHGKSVLVALGRAFLQQIPLRDVFFPKYLWRYVNRCAITRSDNSTLFIFFYFLQEPANRFLAQVRICGELWTLVVGLNLAKPEISAK
jgi:hypothetical protein